MCGCFKLAYENLYSGPLKSQMLVLWVCTTVWYESRRVPAMNMQFHVPVVRPALHRRRCQYTTQCITGSSTKVLEEDL